MAVLAVSVDRTLALEQPWPLLVPVLWVLLSPRLAGGTGWSGLMLVTGATGPEEAKALRQLAPEALFLVPGYGAQGGAAEDAVAGFIGGRGGCVNASRSVIFAEGTAGASGPEAWAAAVGAAAAAAQMALRQAAANLS